MKRVASLLDRGGGGARASRLAVCSALGVFALGAFALEPLAAEPVPSSRSSAPARSAAPALGGDPLASGPALDSASRIDDGAATEDATFGRGLLIVAIDGLRADHLTSFGYDRSTMPYLMQWIASEGTTFTNVWTTGSGVIPAHVSLLTGCVPDVARQPLLPLEDGSVVAPLLNWNIPLEVPRLAEEFLARGWSTGGFVDHATLAGLRGFRQGFRAYFDAGERNEGAERLTGFEGVALRFVQWIKGQDDEDDWFAYLHLNDLERLWTTDLEGLERKFVARPALKEVLPRGEGEPVFFAVPRSRYAAGILSVGEYEALYDAALLQLDRKLARLFGRLQSIGRWRDTTIVVVGSYGLGLGESGLFLDSGGLGPVELHVPLFVRPAPSLGRRVPARLDGLASTMDLPPTLLELFGLEPREGMHGRSLLGWLDATEVAAGGGASAPLEPVRAHCFGSHGAYGGFAVTDGEYFLQVLEPGARGAGLLSMSWFGDDRGHRGEEVELLYRLGPRPTPGRMDWGLREPERSARLRALGVEWFGWMETLQRALHFTSLGRGAPEPSELEALRARGLLPREE